MWEIKVIKSMRKYLLLGLLPLIALVLFTHEYVSLRRPLDPFIAIAIPDIGITFYFEGAEDLTKIQFINPTKPLRVEVYRFLEGVEDFTEIQFVNPSKPPRVEDFRAIFVTLHGEGIVVYKNFYIQYSGSQLQTNGQDIEVHGDVSSYVITTKGDLVPGAALSLIPHR